MMFREWIKLREDVSDKPIIFVKQTGAIVPSEHGGSIKQPTPEEAQKLKTIAAQYGYYYEGVGENNGGGNVEGQWITQSLGAKAKNNGSYDKTINAYNGIGAAITVFSSLQANMSNFSSILKNPQFKTAEDILRYVLTKGISMEKPISSSDAEKFIKIAEADGLRLRNTPAANFEQVAQAAEQKMWGGGNPDGSSSSTQLGKLAYKIEKNRRAKIYQMATTRGGIYFLGSDHLPAMAQEFGV